MSTVRWESSIPDPVIDSRANDIFPDIDGDGPATAGQIAAEPVEVGVEIFRLRCPGPRDDEFNAKSEDPTKVVFASSIEKIKIKRRFKLSGVDRTPMGYDRLLDLFAKSCRLLPQWLPR
jgi:hypothetical protein